MAIWLSRSGRVVEARLGDEAFQVVVNVAQGQVDHRQALEVVGGRQLVGDAHAAVQLHRLLADEFGALAADTVRRRSSVDSDDTFTAASMAIERACSRWMNMSAMRCCSAWNLPIGARNCWRVFR